MREVILLTDHSTIRWPLDDLIRHLANTYGYSLQIVEDVLYSNCVTHIGKEEIRWNHNVRLAYFDKTGRFDEFVTTRIVSKPPTDVWVVSPGLTG